MMRIDAFKSPPEVKLTVTFLSKKYLSVILIPRNISVRNKAFMLLSSTERPT